MDWKAQQLFSEIGLGSDTDIYRVWSCVPLRTADGSSMNLLLFCRRLLSRSSASGVEVTQARADEGDAVAQFGLGQQYSRGDAPNSLQAAEWYRKAAEQGHALAQYNLGLMYANGHGVPRDDAQALLWIRKAAESGYPGAQHNLGGRCHRASFRELKADASECRIEAYKWLFLASAQGYKGSAAACELVTLGMTSAELAEGNHRAATFVGPKAGSENGQDG